ncbi:Patellin-4 [Vitis vinifera]|uniref:Patellin-4 n=1 Tax=Vitis vinifera TaxID=29760 RepID=A0A438DH59_VITVI|nr:Patellin-4 [Vitis vinifera]
MAEEAIPKEIQVAKDKVPQKQEPSKKDVEVEGAATGDVKDAEKDGDPKKFNDPKPGLAALVDDEKENEGVSKDSVVDSLVAERGASFQEESNLPSDLKDLEKKALLDLRSKIEDAIRSNTLFEEEKKQAEEAEKARSPEKEGEEKEKSVVNEGQGEEKKPEELAVEEGKEEEKPENLDFNGEKNETKQKEEEQEKINIEIGEKAIEVDEEIKLWGVPLLPSKGDKGTDVILLKFLRAREFKVQEAFEMLRNTLKWIKDNNIDIILEEEFPPELSSVAYMQGMDRKGHPICYNIFGTFLNDEIYNKTFGTEELRHKFLRWRFQLMERGIKKLDFGSGGATSMLQVNDLRNSPGPTKKELRQAMKQAVGLLQDNYPEFVSRNIFINVPFWSYAFYAVVSPFFTQRSKNKFDFARPARVTETLLKYIDAQQIPVGYGGFHRENDPDFSIEDGVSEVIIKGGSSGAIAIPAPEVGTKFTWEITVLGWDVNYREEFVPKDEGSYTMIVQKERKVGWEEGAIRNSFTNKEAGMLVLTIDNATFKKKRVLYRYKPNSTSTSTTTTPSSSTTT